MKKIITIAIALVIVGGTINDVGKYATSLYYLDQATNEIAEKAADAANKGGGRDVAGGVAVQAAAEQGVEVYGYDQDPSTVRVWTRKQVTGTLLYGPIKALMAKQPWNTPFSVTDEAKAYID